MKIKIFFCLLSLIAILTQGCSNNGSSNDKKTITVSLEPQKYFLDKIVGDKIEVNCLLKSSSNPESYEPSMNDLLTLEKSMAYIKMGNVGFEQSLVDKIKQNSKEITIFDSSHGIEPILGTHDCCHHHEHNHAHHNEASADPHTWTSIKNAKIIARNMFDVVVKIDSINKDFYKSNYDKLISSLDSLDAYATQKLAPHKGEAFLVWHPSLSYFARDYNLEQITLGQIGKELSAKQLQEQIDNARKHKASTFFFQKEYDSQQANVLNEQIGAKITTINPLSYEWEKEIRHIIDAIASAKND